MLPVRGDGLLPTAQAGQSVGVAASTIRTWRQRGVLAPRGLDERGRPLYHRDDVTAADLLVRQRGLSASGIDPRRLRHRAVA
jgi:DNA-binding transcriptional MerR regulator